MGFNVFIKKKSVLDRFFSKMRGPNDAPVPKVAYGAASIRPHAHGELSVCVCESEYEYMTICKEKEACIDQDLCEVCGLWLCPDCAVYGDELNGMREMQKTGMRGWLFGDGEMRQLREVFLQ
jgi:hypothetical protein